MFAAVWHPEGLAEEHVPQAAGAAPLTDGFALLCVTYLAAVHLLSCSQPPQHIGLCQSVQLCYNLLFKH